MAKSLHSLKLQQQEAREYVNAALLALNVSPTELSRQLKVAPSTINRFLSPSAMHTLSLKTIFEINRVSGVAVPETLLLAYGVAPEMSIRGTAIPADITVYADDDVRFTRAPAPAPKGDDPGLGRPNALPVPMPARPDRMNKVPLLGSGQAGPDGIFELNTGEPIDYMDRPPGLTGKSKVYCILVDGNSMDPVYQHGDLLFVDAARKPFPGRDAVIELNPEYEGAPLRAFIKRVVKVAPDYVELFEFQPKERTFRLPRTKIRNLHLVLKNTDMY